MRVLFFGTTGVKKRELMGSIQAAAFAHAVSEGELAGKSDPNDYISILSVEDEILKGSGAGSGLDHIVTYLNAPEHERLRRWKGAMESIISKVDNKAITNHTFLAIHGFYWRGRQLLSEIDLEILKQFNPSVIITLCDDLYDIQSRIKEGDPEGHFNNQLLLREISVWRSAELALADIVARGMQSEAEIKNFLIGVKHSSEMFLKLLFRRDILPIYLSFPISYVRSKKPKVRDQIDKFRTHLGNMYTVFDPLAIDEYLLSDRNPETGKDYSAEELAELYEGKLFVADDHRWHFGKSSAISGYSGATVNGDEYTDTIQDIKRQIPNRDLRLIDQIKWLSGAIVAYRPLIDGHEPGGVRAELSYAHDNTVPVYNLHPEEDRDKTGAFGPLDPYDKCRGPYPNESELMKALSEHSRVSSGSRTWD